MQCPICGSDQPDGAIQCDMCRVVFAKLKPPQKKAEEWTDSLTSRIASRDGHARPLEQDELPKITAMDRTSWIQLAAGLIAAIVILSVPLLNHIFSYLGVLIHEMGHAIWGWLLACPSVPAFDFMYGGGVTTIDNFAPILSVAFALLVAGLIAIWYRNHLTVAVLAGALGLHLLIALTPLRDLVILYMGHGTELLIGGVFVYRALSGSAVIIPAERPLYGAAGFFLILFNARFAYRLMTSVGARWEYGEEKGGGHWMDFDRIADEFLRVSLAQMAGLHLLLCLIPLVLAFLAFRYQEHLWDLSERIADTRGGDT